MEKRYYWLKLQGDFFGSLRIKKLRRMKRGDTLLCIYLKMQLATLSKDGVLEHKGIEEDMASELAFDLGEKVPDVRALFDFLLDNGMLVKTDETHYVLPWVAANTGSETASTQRVRDYRERKALQCNEYVTEVKRDCNVEKEIEKEKDKEIEIDNKRRFTPPTVEQVTAYCKERNNRVDAQTFVDFYSSKGWMIGKNHMKDWKAAVRTWEKTQSDRNVFGKKKNTGYANRVITMDQIIVEDLNVPPKANPKNPALRYAQSPIKEDEFNALVVDLGGQNESV